MATLELCEKYFGTRDVYKLLEVDKDALSNEIKKAYHKLSLQVHPDRVEESEKKLATEKFKVLSKLYQVLTDKGKKAVYDEQGKIDDEDDIMESKLSSWLDLWAKIFKPITVEEIQNYEESYVGSELERNDIKKAYLSGKGCINHMMNEVPFVKVKDEPRLQEIVKKLISDGEVPEYTIFTKEPAKKRARRHKKYARESKEAEQIKEKLLEKNMESGSASLEQQLMERQRSRESSFTTIMDKLMEKYGADDKSDIFDVSKKTKKKGHTKSNKDKIHHVQNGKVKKQKH